MLTCVCCPIVPWWWGWGGLGCFWVVFVLPLSVPGGQLLPAAVVERVLVPCGHDGELSGKFGNWPVPTGERGVDAKYSITRGIRAHELSHSNWGTANAVSHMVLTPFRCSGPKQFDQSLLNTHTRAHRHMHTLLFCKATLVLWRCHPSASFLIQMTLESVLLRFLLSDAREGGRFTAVWEDLGCWRDLGSAGVSFLLPGGGCPTPPCHELGSFSPAA